MLQGGFELLLHRERGTDMQRRRDHVVGRLPAIDMVVGVYLELAGAAGEARNHLVGVHVAGGARAGLENIHGELRSVAAFSDFECGGRHCLGDGGVEQPQPGIHFGSGGLDQPQRGNKTRRHHQAGNREVFHRPLGLRAPECGGGHSQLPHAVVLDAEVWCRFRTLSDAGGH